MRLIPESEKNKNPTVTLNAGGCPATQTEGCQFEPPH